MNKCYLMTRDGFSLLVMGFTGQKALEWKLRYIEAFNEMENSLIKIKNMDITKTSQWEYIKGSTDIIIYLEEQLKKDLKDLENVVRQIDDRRMHMLLYGTQILDMVDELEGAKTVRKYKAQPLDFSFLHK